MRFDARVDVTPPGATTRRQARRAFLTLDAARAFVAGDREQRSEVSRAPRIEPGRTTSGGETVEELCKRWLSTRRDVRPVTLSGYRHALVPVTRHLGSREVASVTLADIEGLVEWMLAEGGSRGQALGRRSVRAALVALAQAFDLAVRDGKITQNVVRWAKPPREEPKRDENGEPVAAPHWSRDELLRFRAHADSDDLAAAWRLTLCGLRRSEVLGLRWDDVDLDSGLVTVRRGRVALDGRDHVDAPKSAQSERVVPVDDLHPGTVALLRALRARQAEDAKEAGRSYRASGYVVVDALGEPIRPENYSDRFRRLSRGAGVPTIRLHRVRHSLADLLLRAGVLPSDGAKLLGHTVEVFLSTYVPRAGKAGAARAAKALGGVLAAEGQVDQPSGNGAVTAALVAV